VTRDKDGKLSGAPGEARAEGGKTGALQESFIHIHVERIDDAEKRDEIAHALEWVLVDVRLCVRDWKPMVARVNEVIADIEAHWNEDEEAA
jgi:glutamate dehydrogenase